MYKGDGKHYWAGGMRVAYGEALKDNNDYYVWMNDDVELDFNAFLRAFDTFYKLGKPSLVVGAMCIPGTEKVSYSGFVKSSKLMPWKFSRLEPWSDHPRPCDTVNGNFVIFPRQIAETLGNIPHGYIQMHADLDLGMAAVRAGYQCWIAPGYLGACDLNLTGRKNYKSAGLSFKQRLKLIEHPLGYPFRPSWTYAWRNFGLWALIMVIAPYISLLKASVRNS